MLERAAGCLENAGQRLLRDSNGAIRSRKSLHPRFWRYNAAESDYPLWYLAFLQASQQRPSRVLSPTQSLSSAADDSPRPFLEFLYPPQTQHFAASWLIRPGKRLVVRRRRKTIPNLTRSYASEAAHHFGSVDKPLFEAASTVRWSQDDQGAHEAQLIEILRADGSRDYDKAWELYSGTGKPSELSSKLLIYLSNSERSIDRTRMKRLFTTIRLQDRSAEVYVHIIKSLLRSGDHSDVKAICEESMAEGVGIPAWAVALTFYVESKQWDRALGLWEVRPLGLENDPSHDALSRLRFSSGLPRLVFSLARSLEEQGSNHGDFRAAELAQFLLARLFTSPDFMRDMAIETVLQLTQGFKKLGLLRADHYSNAIETLQSSKVRSTAIRSVVVYRNFRWQMENEIPSTKLLESILETLASFEVTHGVQYILGEFARFYRKPSGEAYKNALIAFSRTGDVENVQRVFQSLVEDHGKPSSRRFLTPLLYVHARSGKVEETLHEFRRISEEFGLQANTVCWNIVLTAYANKGDLTGAFAALERMLDKRVAPDSHTFGILMGICANRGDIDSVTHLFAVATEHQVGITTSLIDPVVEAFCNNQRLEDAESVAEACLNLDVKGSRVRMFNILLWNYAFRADLDSISRIQSRMRAAGLQPDGMTYAALMLSLVVIGRPDSARRLLRTLHKSHRMHATEFHYAIVLFGYVKARNRDMVHILYREITERFSRPGFSSRLLVLKSLIQRDLQSIKEGRGVQHGTNTRLAKAEAFLAETIAEFDINQPGSKQPQPGSAKQSLKEAFPAMYYSHLISAYGTAGAFERVKELFEEFEEFTKTGQSPQSKANEAPPLRLLAALMSAHLKDGQYSKVEESWKMALPRAIKAASRPDIEAWLSPAQLPAVAEDQPPQPSLPDSIREKRPLVISSPASFPRKADAVAPILSSHRFMLSRCLSLYMRSLAYQNQPWRIPEAVAEVESAGFSLTTHNWSTYVQMLTSSERSSDQFKGFVTFEEKFMPNFPGWYALRRGFGVRPKDVPATIDEAEDPRRGKLHGYLGKGARKIWTKFHPDFMQPTYISMMYLGSALLDFRERSIVDGGAELKALYEAAPKTIKAIADMPYLRDKFQGVLIRRREERGDQLASMEPYEYFVWTGGVLGVDGQSRLVTESTDREPATEESAAIKTSLEGDVDSLKASEKVLKDRSKTGSFEREVTRDNDAEEQLDHIDSLSEAAEPPEQTLDYQDEQDIEAETVLESRRRALGTDPLGEDRPVDIDKEQVWVDIPSMLPPKRVRTGNHQIDGSSAGSEQVEYSPPGPTTSEGRSTTDRERTSQLNKKNVAGGQGYEHHE